MGSGADRRRHGDLPRPVFSNWGLDMDRNDQGHFSHIVERNQTDESLVEGWRKSDRPTRLKPSVPKAPIFSKPQKYPLSGLAVKI